MAKEQPMQPTFNDVCDARERIKGHAVRTPLLESSALNARVGGRVLIKPECLQRTGSFKFRGAWNCISRLDEAKRKNGVVAYSSGNHAQGVAAAAQLRDMPAVIVMPEDTPEIKKNNTRNLGAEVVTYDRAGQSRLKIAQALAEERDAVIVPPFDHPDIIAGQGTAGAEIIEDASARDAKLDAMLVCTGGGGLSAGVALSFQALSPDTDVYCVEPEKFDDYTRSLARGERQTNSAATGSMCDALLSGTPGELTFAINRNLLAGGLVVTDDEVAEAMRYAFTVLKLVVEPGGAVALAAVLSGKIDCADQTVGVMVSGGNVDPHLMSEVLAAAA